MEGAPKTGISGFGVFNVNGRSLDPSPAARISPSEIVVMVKDLAKVLKFRVLHQVFSNVFESVSDVFQIVRVAPAIHKRSKTTDGFKISLNGHEFENSDKMAPIS